MGKRLTLCSGPLIKAAVVIPLGWEFLQISSCLSFPLRKEQSSQQQHSEWKTNKGLFVRIHNGRRACLLFRPSVLFPVAVMENAEVHRPGPSGLCSDLMGPLRRYLSCRVFVLFDNRAFHSTSGNRKKAVSIRHLHYERTKNERKSDYIFHIAFLHMMKSVLSCSAQGFKRRNAL